MSRFSKIVYLMFIAMVMAGCSSIPEQPTSVEWQSHQIQLEKLTHYQATGKLAYISPEQRQSLNFIWKHSPQQSQLRLTTFLGQTALNLTIDTQGAKVVTYDDKVFTHQDASVLVKQLTGLSIPVQHMPQWLLGNPEQADSYILNDDTNTLASLSKVVGHQFWQLDYTSYRNIELTSSTSSNDKTNSPLKLPLPAKLTFKQDQTRINIVISKWTLTK